ncbi:MAG: ABC transporter permease [Acidobacteria bacterium]|nr:ABC transporter permease [Acidobacteriota bacterium]
MSLKAAPLRLTAGLGMIGLIILACGVGPWLLRPLPGMDPARAALLPPGSRVTVVQCRNGAVYMSPRVEKGARAIAVLGPGNRRIEIETAQIARVFPHRYWLGSDRFGRDLLRESLSGGRISLAVASLALAIALVIGGGIGLAAATSGTLVDTLLMRLVDAFLAFPILFLLILAVALFRPGPSTLVVVLGLTSWMGLARLVRGQVLSLRQRDFVQAARVAGSPWWRIWELHYAPNLVGPVAQDAALRLGDLVLAEATLSYLGLGIPPSTPTWGSLVAEGHKVLLQGWWLATFPGIAIAVLVIALALVGDGLQDLVRSAR